MSEGSHGSLPRENSITDKKENVKMKREIFALLHEVIKLAGHVAVLVALVFVTLGR